MPCREVRSMLLSWLFPYRQKDGFPCPNKGKQPAYAFFAAIPGEEADMILYRKVWFITIYILTICPFIRKMPL